MTSAMTFAVLIRVNQIPKIHSAAFSDDLLSFSLVYHCAAWHMIDPTPGLTFFPTPCCWNLKTTWYALALHDPVWKAVSKSPMSSLLSSHSCVLLSFSFWLIVQHVPSSNHPEFLSWLSLNTRRSWVPLCLQFFMNRKVSSQ